MLALPKFFREFQTHPSSSPPSTRRTRSITLSPRIHHYASATAMASKVHLWISYLICLLHRPVVNFHHEPRLPKQTFSVSKQNERLPSSVLRVMQQEKLGGRHIPRIALQSSFGTLIRSKKSLGYIHTRFGTRGTCSMYTFKSCARRGSSWAYIYTVSQAWIPYLRLLRRYKLALEASATTTGYRRFHDSSSLPSRHPLSVIPHPCNQFGVEPPALPHQPRRTFTRPTNRVGIPFLRYHLRSLPRSPTETRARLSLPTFPYPVRARRDPLSRGLRACPTCFLSARAGAGNRVRCDRTRWARSVRMDSRSRLRCLHLRSSV